MTAVEDDLIEGIETLPEPPPPDAAGAAFTRAAADGLRRTWRTMVLAVAKADTVPQLHLKRDRVRKAFERTAARAESFARYAAAADAEVADELAAAAADARKFVADLFDKWMTEKDLYEVLIAMLTPTHEQLRRLVEKYPPPQWWFEMDHVKPG